MDLKVKETSLPTDEAQENETQESEVVLEQEQEPALAASQNGMIRVLDDKGHLLFKYNPQTQSIEIKVPVGRSADKGKVFSVSTNILRSAGSRNVISEHPVWQVEAELMEWTTRGGVGFGLDVTMILYYTLYNSYYMEYSVERENC